MESPESMDINVRAGDNERTPDRWSAADDDSTTCNRTNDLQIHLSRTHEQFGSVCSHGFCAILEFCAVLEFEVMKKADADVEEVENRAKRVSTTNAAGWIRSLRTFGPNFKLAYHMYFWFTMFVNKENTESNKIETFMNIVAPNKDGRDKTALLQNSWITAGHYAAYPNKEFYENLPGATTEKELDINDGDDEKQRTIYFQTVAFKNTEKVGNAYETDKKVTMSDSNFIFRMVKRMNLTQTHAGASAATLPVHDGFYLHDETCINSNTKCTLLHRDSYENHENAGDASDPEILREKVFERIPWISQFSKFLLFHITGMVEWQKAQSKKQKHNEKKKNMLFGPLSSSSMQLQRG